VKTSGAMCSLNVTALCALGLAAGPPATMTPMMIALESASPERSRRAGADLSSVTIPPGPAATFAHRASVAKEAGHYDYIR